MPRDSKHRSKGLMGCGRERMNTMKGRFTAESKETSRSPRRTGQDRPPCRGGRIYTRRRSKKADNYCGNDNTARDAPLLEHAMRATDCLPWFESVIRGFNSLKKYPCSNYSPVAYHFDQEDSRAWAAEAEAALAAVFPASHPFRQAWSRLDPQTRPNQAHGVTLEQLLGVFRAATKQLQEGRSDARTPGRGTRYSIGRVST